MTEHNPIRKHDDDCYDFNVDRVLSECICGTKDDWNLAKYVIAQPTDYISIQPIIRLDNFKTFIQKVKETKIPDQIIIPDRMIYIEGRDVMTLLKRGKQIVVEELDKRTGRL